MYFREEDGGDGDEPNAAISTRENQTTSANTLGYNPFLDVCLL